MLDYGLAARIAYFFLGAQEEFFKGVSKECFSKNIKKFQKKTSALDCTFIVNLQVKPTTLLKLYLKTVFPEIFFRNFWKSYFTFRYLLPLQRLILNPIKNLCGSFLEKIVMPKSSTVDILRGSKYVSALFEFL